jgi:hypothetical protein
LVTAFTDLGSHGRQGDVVPEMREGFFPCLCVKVTESTSVPSTSKITALIKGLVLRTSAAKSDALAQADVGTTQSGRRSQKGENIPRRQS